MSEIIFLHFFRQSLYQVIGLCNLYLDPTNHYKSVRSSKTT